MVLLITIRLSLVGLILLILLCVVILSFFYHYIIIDLYYKIYIYEWFLLLLMIVTTSYGVIFLVFVCCFVNCSRKSAYHHACIVLFVLCDFLSILVIFWAFLGFQDFVFFSVFLHCILFYVCFLLVKNTFLVIFFVFFNIKMLFYIYFLVIIVVLCQICGKCCIFYDINYWYLR